MSEHTSGPWHATNHFDNDDTPCNCAYVLSEGYAGSICDISVANGRWIGDGGNDAPPRAEAAANGLLIAAAPDLLAACQAYAAAYDGATGTIHVNDQVRAAIKRATTPARNTSQIGEG